MCINLFILNLIYQKLIYNISDNFYCYKLCPTLIFKIFARVEFNQSCLTKLNIIFFFYYRFQKFNFHNFVYRSLTNLNA